MATLTAPRWTSSALGVLSLQPLACSHVLVSCSAGADRQLMRPAPRLRADCAPRLPGWLCTKSTVYLCTCSASEVRLGQMLEPLNESRVHCTGASLSPCHLQASTGQDGARSMLPVLLPRHAPQSSCPSTITSTNTSPFSTLAFLQGAVSDNQRRRAQKRFTSRVNVDDICQVRLSALQPDLSPARVTEMRCADACAQYHTRAPGRGVECGGR